MIQSFDYWQNGVPIIIPQSPGDFSEWMNGAPVVDVSATAVFFSGTGIAAASAAIGAKIALSVTGTGVSTASVALGARVSFPASGIGIATAGVALGAIVGVTVSGSGISSASAVLTGTGPPPPPSGGSRRASPRQSSFRVQDYTAHKFCYRMVRSQQEQVRHLGD
jgi:hypothetical protein